MNAKHQAEYFDTRTKHGMKKRYERLARVLGLVDDPKRTVIDIGCGAFGGIFLVRRFGRMIGIDPLWHKYNPASCPAWVEKATGTFDAFGTDVIADVIVCADALNYYDKPNRFAAEAIKHLRPSGRIMLHMNLRSPKQMNAEHPYYFTHENIDNAFSVSGLKQVRKVVMKPDPTNGKPYKTYIGEWVYDPDHPDRN